MIATGKICDIFIHLVRTNYLTVRTIPLEFWTSAFAEFIVEINGRTLEYIPDIFKTQKVCELAVSENYRAIEYVPDGKLTKEMCQSVLDRYELVYMSPSVLQRVLEFVRTH